VTRYILDTNAAAKLINRIEPIYELVRSHRLAGYRVGICTPVLAELWAGVRLSANPDREALLMRRMLPALRPCWPFDEPAAEEYGRVFAYLRRAGRPMQRTDMQIAAIARMMRATVVTSDSDFQAVRGLTCENWEEQSPSSSRGAGRQAR